MEILAKARIIPTASKPPNAPDTEAAEKKSAARIPNSERLYQLNGAEFEVYYNKRLERTMRGSSSLRGIIPPRIPPTATSHLEEVLWI